MIPMDPRLNHLPAQAGYGEGNPGVRPAMVNPIAQRAGMQINANPAVNGSARAPMIANGQPVVGGVR